MNTFTRQLAEGTPKAGLWLSLGSATVAEICAIVGYDWLLIDSEHAPNDLNSVLAQLRAIEPHTTAVVRPFSMAPDHLAPLLDIGVRNLLVPRVDSVEQARQLVRAVRYPPRGPRGVASGLIRASRFGRTSDYIRTADETLCLIAQIETPQAVEAAGDIAAVHGIDALFVGLYDLSAAMDHIDNPGHPAVRNAFHHVVAVAHQAGKPVGAFTPTARLASAAHGVGCDFIAYGSDVGLLGEAASQALTVR